MEIKDFIQKIYQELIDATNAEEQRKILVRFF